MMCERPSFQFDQPRRELYFAHRAVVRPERRRTKAVEILSRRGRAGPNQRCDHNNPSPFHSCSIINFPLSLSPRDVCSGGAASTRQANRSNLSMNHRTRRLTFFRSLAAGSIAALARGRARADVEPAGDTYVNPRKVLLWESTRKEFREAMEG